jgi:hypothetical protein
VRWEKRTWSTRRIRKAFFLFAIRRGVQYLVHPAIQVGVGVFVGEVVHQHDTVEMMIKHLPRVGMFGGASYINELDPVRFLRVRMIVQLWYICDHLLVVRIHA